MTGDRSTSIPLIGYGVAIALILAVAVVAIAHLDAAAADRLSVMRDHEQQVTLAERLRWRSELKIAAGRGYVITGNIAFREKWQQASAGFVDLWRDLRRAEDDAASASWLDEAAAAARAYDAGQDRLHSTGGAEDLAERLERELLPARVALGDAIDAYVARQRALLAAAYDDVEAHRERARALAFGAIFVVALVAVALFWFTTRALRRSRDREREALRRVEHALAARDEVLGVVAHDLRNPLAAIALKATLLRETSTTERTRRTAESIEKTAERMAHLINGLLDVAVIESGTFAVVPGRWLIEEILQDTAAMLEGVAAARSIALVQRPGARGLAVHVDRERIIQVLSNLVGNAIKFTPDGGRVELAVEADEPGWARVVVTDTGPGIPEGQMDHLFERFWKQDKGGIRGTGLGLFIARGIVDAHGGRIWARSAAGAGASFTFTIPVATSSPAAAGHGGRAATATGDAARDPSSARA